MEWISVKDKLLIENSAKAIKIKLDWTVNGTDRAYYINSSGGHSRFDPLNDSEDALMVAVSLRMHIAIESVCSNVWMPSVGYYKMHTVPNDIDPKAALRKAIVACASGYAESRKL